ncbi:CRISPR-associated protein Cas4 [Stieleria sp. TO1_6]|uniref:CRISPR-associated protein Cas4 n=1 Tax=Stieleria tagensis TaxID=2956795 RepID=UPI00209B19E7|nr:CRISPR-associated protein Cas4 [Stieleria tagensis]MCO8124950.1 CRISPR-associated protein Cas4 [Stieleria tagensis]
MTYHEDDLLPISALQHLLFCPRQCALIHVEQLWAENQLTVEGMHLHEKADTPQHSVSGGANRSVRVERALPIRSLQWGLIGKADVVEFHFDDAKKLQRIVPVEYKRGRPKRDDSDRVQLCAQALCLEEMCDTEITEGALFYGTQRRRLTTVFDPTLRSVTLDAIDRFRQMSQAGETPPAVFTKACKKCSLIEFCMPTITTGSRDVNRFINRQLQAHLDAAAPLSD